jgi:hypothetical protein
MTQAAPHGGAAPSNLSSAYVRIQERTVAEPDVRAGIVRVPRELLRRLGLNEGEMIRIEFDGEAILLRAMAGAAPWAESNPRDLMVIGARSGARLIFVADNTTQHRS